MVFAPLIPNLTPSSSNTKSRLPPCGLSACVVELTFISGHAVGALTFRHLAIPYSTEGNLSATLVLHQTNVVTTWVSSLSKWGLISDDFLTGNHCDSPVTCDDRSHYKEIGFLLMGLLYGTTNPKKSVNRNAILVSLFRTKCAL